MNERDPLLRSTVLSVWGLDRPPDLEQFRNALGEGKMRDLLDLAAPIMSQACDKDRPVWELHVVDGMTDGVDMVLFCKTSAGCDATSRGDPKRRRSARIVSRGTRRLHS